MCLTVCVCVCVPVKAGPLPRLANSPEVFQDVENVRCCMFAVHMSCFTDDVAIAGKAKVLIVSGGGTGRNYAVDSTGPIG